jgi:hypothetical protein
MKFFSGRSVAVLLLLGSLAAYAGPSGAIDVGSPGASEYRVDMGGGFFHQRRRLRTTGAGKFDLTRNEVYGTLQYTGYDWSIGARLGGASFDEKSAEPASSGSDRTFGFQPMIGIVAKGLIASNLSGDFAVGATLQATSYQTNAYQNYLNVGAAITAQQRWGGIATIYGGPFLSMGGGRRKGGVIDNNTGLAQTDYIKETPVGGICAGFNFALPKAMSFGVEGQYMGIGGGKGIATGLSDWGVGAMLRLPLVY